MSQEILEGPVSYTHLDVYKRQAPDRGGRERVRERGASAASHAGTEQENA